MKKFLNINLGFLRTEDIFGGVSGGDNVKVRQLCVA